MPEVWERVTDRPLDIVVVGGSLGGLFAGIVLKRLGHHVHILERSANAVLDDQGAGIVARGHTQEFLELYDLTRTPAAVSSGTRQWLDRAGTVAESIVTQQKMTSWDLLYRILRANFDGLALGSIRPLPHEEQRGAALYELGCVLSGLELVESDGRVRASYSKDCESRNIMADLVIGADGASSTVRQLFEPSIKRRYVGYVAWRGTLLESQASTQIRETLVDRITFFHGPNTQILVYLIPGRDGSLEVGKRLINWVWYVNYEANSPALAELMTDSSGRRHNLSLPMGAMQPQVWEKQKGVAAKQLPTVLADLVQATTLPFIQCVTDVLSPRNCYMAGRVFLVGDATAGLRPHPAASTARAAFDAMLLAKTLKGEITRQEWEQQTMAQAREMQELSVRLGQKSQFEEHSLGELTKR